MFSLTFDEYHSLRSQIGTLKRGEHAKYTPFAFTEQGIAMLSSVLHSERAIQVNIAIMRAFVKLRQLLRTNEELNRKMTDMEKKYDKQFKVVFQILQQLMEPPKKPRKEIGFRASSKK